jgi:hypothetical protein
MVQPIFVIEEVPRFLAILGPAFGQHADIPTRTKAARPRMIDHYPSNG